MIIDAHIHLWNPLRGDGEGVERRALQWGKAEQNGQIYYAAPPTYEDSQSTWERAAACMDYVGVDRAVVLQEFMDGKQDDYLVEVRRACPTRFSCMALFDRACWDDPLGCFELAIVQRQLQGFLVLSPSRFPEIAVPKLMPLWQACADHGLPVVLKDGAPADVRKLLRAIPTLKVVLSHFGGCFGPEDAHRERLELVASTDNAYLDSGALTYRQRYPFTLAQERLHRALEIVGEDKICWGSDFPRPPLVVDSSYTQQLEFITRECHFLSETQRAKILGENALRIYPWDQSAS